MPNTPDDNFPEFDLCSNAAEEFNVGNDNFPEFDSRSDVAEEINNIQQNSVNRTPVEDFTTTLRNLHNKVKDTVTYFNVNRENIFMNCKLTLQRRNFDPFNRLSVNFVDSDDKTEGAIDGGGPSAEMFRLCMSYFQTSCLFEGKTNSKQLTYHINEINEKNYFYCGQIIGMSILHGYSGPRFFSEFLFNFLSCGIDTMSPKMSDLPDGKLKDILEQISATDSLNDIQNVILEEDMISIAGWSFISNIDEKQNLIDGKYT